MWVSQAMAVVYIILFISGCQTCCNPNTYHQTQTQTVTNEENEEEGGYINLREEAAEEVEEGLNDDTVEEDGENEWD